MPVYEYACHQCRMVFQFFSKTIGVQKTPECPKCHGEDMERLLSSFSAIATSKTKESEMNPEGGASPGDTEDPFAGMSPARQQAAEREMARLMSDAESLDENDPRQLGRLMERMSQITGLEDKEMEVAIRRLKDGEDPEKIEEDMGELFGDEESGAAAGGVGGYGMDPGMYDM